VIRGEGYEAFLGKKYVGTKRFGLDGGESMIPALEAVIKYGGSLGVREIIYGMAHRGRLNVLANVMAKPYRVIFHEFSGGTANPEDVGGSGDVKYHLGTSTDREFDGIKVHMSLVPNPRTSRRSTRWCSARPARSRRSATTCQARAGAAGADPRRRGVRRPGHRVGVLRALGRARLQHRRLPALRHQQPDRLHHQPAVRALVALPVGRRQGHPGADPARQRRRSRAVTFACKLAIEYRQKFGNDIVIDMWCYRRFGHNEGDEPSFTQPLMYRPIRQHPRVSEVYAARLIAEGRDRRAGAAAHALRVRRAARRRVRGRQELQAQRGRLVRRPLERAAQAGRPRERAAQHRHRDRPQAVRQPRPHADHGPRRPDDPQDARPRDRGQAGDVRNRRRVRLGDRRGARVRQPRHRGLRRAPVGPGFGPRHVQPAPRDLGRPDTERKFIPLCELPHGKFEVYDSPLSEYGVLGFEYGFASADPKTLVCWEAQFGDFGNGAQIIIDQYIAAGEAKWLRANGLVLLLPHGFEGQGPEHSSARLERFLQLCADDNIQVCNITSPANYFHVLRRQMKRPFRKPLVIMTPKSLLRTRWPSRAPTSSSPRATSSASCRPQGDRRRQGPPAGAVQRQGRLRPDGSAREGAARGCLDRPPRAALPVPRRAAGGAPSG
jgi:2-oxoglutarate dehydrogenase E1 component